MSQYTLIDTILAVNPLIEPATAGFYADQAPDALLNAYLDAETDEQEKIACRAIAAWVKVKLTSVPFFG